MKLKAKTASPIPNQKIAASGLTGATTILLFAVAKRLDIHISAEEAAALTTVFSFLVGYFTSPRVGEIRHVEK